MSPTPTLRPLQAEALEPLRERWVHGDPPGSGKTPVGLTWLRRHNVRTALIVCPSNVVRHWERQAKIWFPEASVVAVPKGTAAKHREGLRSSFVDKVLAEHQTVYVTSYALMREDQAALVSMKWGAVVFDEAHRLKSRSTQLHKVAAKIARRTPLVLCATGSPILNSADEAWSLLHLLAPEQYSSFWGWAREHFIIEQTSFNGRLPRPITRIVCPKQGALERIADEFQERYVARPASVMLPHIEAPEHILYEIDLTAAERKVYDSLRQRGWALMDDDILLAPNAVASLTRQRQLASDWASVNSEVGVVGSKVSAAASLALDLGEPVLVFVSFKETARVLAEHVHAVVFTGDQGQVERDAAVEAFTSGTVPVLIGTYGALAEGTDGLQHVAHHVILLDHDWVPEIERQAIGRLARDGQTKRVIVHHIVARDTVDQVIAEKHIEKLAAAKAVTGQCEGV